eukprot:364355-Chlamydomonas_euryale.AAC.11
MDRQAGRWQAPHGSSQQGMGPDMTARGSTSNAPQCSRRSCPDTSAHGSTSGRCGAHLPQRPSARSLGNPSNVYSTNCLPRLPCSSCIAACSGASEPRRTTLLCACLSAPPTPTPSPFH